MKESRNLSVTSTRFHAINFLSKFFVVSNDFILPLGIKLRQITLFQEMKSVKSFSFKLPCDFYVKLTITKEVVVFFD